MKFQFLWQKGSIEKQMSDSISNDKTCETNHYLKDIHKENRMK